MKVLLRSTIRELLYIVTIVVNFDDWLFFSAFSIWDEIDGWMDGWLTSSKDHRQRMLTIRWISSYLWWYCSYLSFHFVWFVIRLDNMRESSLWLCLTLIVCSTFASFVLICKFVFWCLCVLFCSQCKVDKGSRFSSFFLLCLIRYPMSSLSCNLSDTNIILWWSFVQWAF